MSVQYKRPVAVIGSESGLMLSSSGQVFSSKVKVAGLPVIVPPQSTTEQNLSIVGGWRSREAAALCSAIGISLPDLNWRVGISRTGFVNLVPGTGARVELGSLDGSKAKIAALSKILKDDPTLLTKISKLTLYSPEKPLVER